MPLLADTKLPYDRDSVTPGILHFGVGQFCRGHLFYYTHRLFELLTKQGGKPKLDYGIIGVNVMKGERERQMWVDFKKQNFLYSLNLFPYSMNKDTPPGPPQTTVIGTMVDYVYAPEELDKVLGLLADPRIRIVSMTITEGGYNIDETTDEFDLSNPDVQADLRNPRRPKTTFGLIVEGLRKRMESGGRVKPFTVMSCDNLRHNGNVARKAILGYAKALDKTVAAWIEKNVRFPNSMVDRITPTTTLETKRMLQSLPNGIKDDEQPVIGESFNQWVLEDKFVNGVRPAWEKVGLELTDDVAGYEHTKIRILNSSHLFVTFAGLLLGYRTVHEALADKDIRQLVDKSLDMDILPTLTSPMDKAQYRRTILARFSNAAIADQLLRIAGDGTSKVQVFWANNVMAVMTRSEKLRASGKANDAALGLDNFAFGLACFLLYLKGKDCFNKIYPVVEPKLAPASWKSVMQPADANPPAPKFDGDEAKAMLGFNAFDPWRSQPGRAQLEKRMIFYYNAMRSKGVREAMRLLPGWKASGAAAKL